MLERFNKDEELPQQFINSEVAQDPKLDQGGESGKHDKQEVLEQFIKDKELPQQFINNEVAEDPKLDQGGESGKHDEQELLEQSNEVEEPEQDQDEEDEGDDNLGEPTSGIAQVCLICEKYYLY